MRQRQAGFAIVGAVVGAGFASGREVMYFFTRFGAWAIVGIALAVLVIGFLALRLMQISSDRGADCFLSLCHGVFGRIGGLVGILLYAAMLVATGGAMLSGAGELCAIAVPITSAYGVGFCAMLLSAIWVAARGMGGLAAVSSAMVPLCYALYILLILLPSPSPGLALLPPAPWWQALPLALSYAALNIGLVTSILCEAGAMLPGKERRGAAGIAAGILGVMLLLAHVALAPNAAALRAAPLPMVISAARLGLVGFWLSVGTLALAMLTTLAAVLRALFLLLPQRWGEAVRWVGGTGLCALLGLLGFDRLIGGAYPVLGWCVAALIAAICLRAGALKGGE